MSVKEAALRIYFLIRLPIIFAVRCAGGLFIGKADGPMKILLIRLDRLGDLILTVPVVENLKQHYPDARITVLVRPYLAQAARLVKAIDSVIVYDGPFSTVIRLRRERFSIAIDMLCDYTLRPALLALFSGAPRRVGFDIGSRGLLFTDPVPPPTGKRHMASVNLDILKALDVPAKVTIPRIILDAAAVKRDAIVAIHPGGHYPSQRWPADRFASVAGKLLNAYNIKVVIMGGPDDRPLVGSIMRTLPVSKARAVFPDLDEMARILARASLLICNNSGPLHLAAALGTATVSTMGPTDPALWWPLGDNQVVVRKKLTCSPCGAGRCGRHACMDLITSDEIFENAKAILDKADGIRKL